MHTLRPLDEENPDSLYYVIFTQPGAWYRIGDALPMQTAMAVVNYLNGGNADPELAKSFLKTVKS